MHCSYKLIYTQPRALEFCFQYPVKSPCTLIDNHGTLIDNHFKLQTSKKNVFVGIFVPINQASVDAWQICDKVKFSTIRFLVIFGRSKQEIEYT